MPAASFFIIGAAAISQVMLGRHVAFPWLIPDLVLVTISLGILQDPSRAAVPILSGAFWAAVWTGSMPWQAAWAYGGAGCLIQQLARRVDLTAPNRVAILVGVAELACVGILLFTSPVRPWSLLLVSGLRVGLTVIVLPIVRWVVGALERTA